MVSELPGSILRNEPQNVPLVIIVTALAKEFNAVKKHISNPVEVVDRRGNVLESGEFTDPGRTWKVMLVQTGAGNHEAISIVNHVTDEYMPNLVMLVGISGALKSDLKIGDVVAASEVCYGEAGKEEEEFLARPRTVPVKPPLIQRAMAIARNSEWLSRIEKYDVSNHPSAFVAPIAAIEKVLANSASYTSENLRRHYNGCYVVEMEGYGMMKATFDLDTPAIVIRSVSDCRDGKADSDKSGSQELACKHAAAFAFEFLGQFTPPPAFQVLRKVVGREELGRIAKKESEPGLPQEKAELTLVFEGNIGDLTDQQLKMIENRLKQLAVDNDVKVRSVESGSIILNIQGSREGLQRIRKLQGDGKLSSALEAPVVAVYEREQYLKVRSIKQAFKDASKSMLNWPTTIDGEHWLKRREIGQIEEVIAAETTSSTIVLGPPGSGKSAIIAKLAGRYADAEIPILAIKADTLSTDIDSEEKLSNALGLPTSITNCVSTLAQTERVLVCIDQLDAVAGLVDLHSRRLNVLVLLINRFAQMPNVHVVSSSRDFELRHDVRLTTIKAEAVILDLPSWVQVSEVLASKGIDASQWPERFRNILRTPQHLKIFISLLEKQGQQRIYESYQAMLEALWRGEVLGKGHIKRAKLLAKIAAEMGDKESLWLPIARVESDLQVVDDLVSAGILASSQQGTALSFCHQTLFDYAWARTFVSDGAHLSSYVLARQDGLYVRPKVWTAMLYLREADPAKYKEQFVELWKSTDLRKHLRLLLVDFLGYIEEPDTQEVKWFFEIFKKPELANRALLAAIGNRRWFDELSKAYLPLVMRQDVPSAWSSRPLLIRALAFDSGKVLELIKQNWLPDTQKDELTLHVLQYLKDWDENSIDLASQVMARTNVPKHLIVMLATAAAEKTPELASKIIRAGIQSEIRRIKANKKLYGHKNIEFRDKELLESHEWYGLPAVAEASPREFLVDVWPLFVDLVKQITQPRTFPDHFYSTAYIPLESESGKTEEEPLVESVKIAMLDFAKRDKANFSEFLNSAKNVEVDSIQRILVWTLIKDIEHYHKEALYFLLEDERRFFLGSLGDAIKDSVKLIKALTPNLKQDEIGLLEPAILRIGTDIPPGKDQDHPLERSKWFRAKRLALLKAMPYDRLSVATQREIEQEERALPIYQSEEDVAPEFGWVGSPMSAEQMKKAKNTDIVRLFEKLKDTTEWNYPKKFLKGGSVQASREFKEFAKSCPKRAMSIIDHLKPGEQERPVGYALEALAESNVPSAEIFRIFLDLKERGFASQEFKDSATMAVRKRIEEGIGLPEKVCEVLEEWLASDWNPIQDNHQESEGSESVLWGNDRIYSIPQGSFTVIETLTRAYLGRNPLDTKRWLSMLKAHLNRPEHPSVWRAFALDLRYLIHCDPDQASQFLIELFEKYPNVRDSIQGAMLLAYVLKWLNADIARQLLGSLKTSNWTYGPQAFGELVLLHHGLFPEQEWSSREINAALTIQEPIDERADKIRTGLAYASANMWNELGFREMATEVMLKLGAKTSTPTAQAIMSTFKKMDSLYPDNATRQVFQMIADHPEIWQQSNLSSFAEQLEEMLPIEPVLVYRICRGIVDFATTHTTVLNDFSGLAGTLTNIALTLQRYEAEHRRHGIELFETLLELNSNDAWNAINELDGRPADYSLPQRPHRRRSRRKHA